MSDAERRFASQFNDGQDMPVQVRAAEDRRTIGGYAAKFDKLSQNLGGFKERIAPGFFNYSRSQGWPGVVARYNHDDNQILGTSAIQSLRMDIDNVGLRYDVDINQDDQSALNVYARVQRGDVRQSSFAFIADEDEWDSLDGFPRRTLITGRLHDVAPVNTPAYLDTSVGLRSLAVKFEADVTEVRSMAAENDLMRFFKRTDNTGKPAPAKNSAAAALAKALSLKA